MDLTHSRRPPSVKCSYSSCEQRFESEKDMERHKQRDPDHDYCRKCDVDCEDWEDFLQHKVDSMQSWLAAYARAGAAVPAPKHITCEFCGLDFNTMGGRRLHLEQRHPATLCIRCPGCNEEFGRAAAYVGHLEMGQCSEISRLDFISSIEQKHIVKQIMQDPGLFMDNLQNPPSPAQSPMTAPSLEEGVPLESFPPLIPPPSSSQQSPSSTAETAPSPALGQHMTRATGRMTKGPTESFPPLIPSLDDTPSPPQRWASLLGEKTNAGEELAAALPELDEENNPPSSSNLLHNRFWDPRHSDYQPHLFLLPSGSARIYFCPFVECDKTQYLTREDLESHLLSWHARRQMRCPLCLKVCPSSAALIAHAEAPGGRCRVRESASYARLVDEVSGGYLMVVDVPRQARPGVWREERALVQHGKVLEGVVKVLYEGKMPGDR